MKTLDYILKKFHLTFNKHTPMPLAIPNYGRDNLPSLFAELRFKLGAEIGVENGTYSEQLLKGNPDLKLYSIDPWKVNDDYPYQTVQSKFDKSYDEACTRLAPYGNSHIVRKFSLDAVRDFDDNSLDFVYIDASHTFQSVTNDICEWLKKVRTGGIISGHDYMGCKTSVGIHVKYVVLAYTNVYKIRPWFVLGAENKKRGQIRDKARSWMWVKQN